MRVKQTVLSILLALSFTIFSAMACETQAPSRDATDTGSAKTGSQAAPVETKATKKNKAPTGEAPIPPSVAGTFYSGDPAALQKEVQAFIKPVPQKELSGLWGLIAPHAGYRFSGPIAASAFAQLKNRKIRTLVVIAFAHRPVNRAGTFIHEGVGTTLARSFITPLGELAVDLSEVGRMMHDYPFIKAARELFIGEHSLEVELPFLQTLAPEAKLVPIIFGTQQDPELARKVGQMLAERFIPREDCLVVASTDMSHYFPYDQAVEMDLQALEMLKALEAEKILALSPERRVEFCGVMPTLSMIYAQRQIKGPEPIVLDYRNSGDTFGDKQAVVGYAAVAFLRNKKAHALPDDRDRAKPAINTLREKKKMSYSLTDEQKKQLIGYARQTVEIYVTSKTKPNFEVTDKQFLEKGAVFVTLKKAGQLRGCIGHTEPHFPLWECVREMAVAACSQDPRFPPVRPDELDELEYEITVLTPMQKVDSVEDIKVGRDGLMMEKGFNRGLLLPQVPVEWGWNRDQFLDHTAQKAGLPASAWRDGSVTIYSFEGLVFDEKSLEISN